MFLKRLLVLEVAVMLLLSLFVVSAHPGDHQHPSPAAMITVNVELTDTGFVPSLVAIPAGQQIQLVVRNRGTREHHYHIVGLEPADLLWLSKEDTSNISPEAHGAHHGGEFVPYHICKSGVCPTGIAVHAHAAPGDIDVVIFTATNTGTFEVLCPLHSEIKGQVVAF